METSTPVENKDMILHQSTKSLNYQIKTTTLLETNDGRTKNTIEADITKTFIHTDSFGHLFSLETKNRKQSNIEDLSGLEEKLSLLLKKLTLYCNGYGEIVKIANKSQIKEDWYFQKKDIRKEYSKTIPKIDDILHGAEELIKDEAAFIKLITKSEIGTLLFPPIYKQQLLTKKQLRQNKEFTHFFDDYELPLVITTSLIEDTDTINNQIIRSGVINNLKFKTPEVKRFFRKLYNAQDLAVDIDVAYLETYDLDMDNDIYSASQMMGIEIDKLYSYRQISKLKKTTYV